MGTTPQSPLSLQKLNDLIELSLPIIADARCVFVHLWAKVTQEHEGLGVTGVFKSNTRLGTGLGAEVFVLGQLVETDQLGAIQRLAIDGAFALHADAAPSALVSDRALAAGIDGEFLGREELLLFDAAINDPAINVAFAAGVGHGDRLEVMVILEIRIDVAGPVELIDNEIEILVLALGHVLHEQTPRHLAAFDKALVHAKHITAPLRFVGAETTRRVQHAGRNQPAGAGLEAVGFGEIEDTIVALVPILEALAHLCLGGAGLEAHESVREVVANVVVLRREIVALRFAFLLHQFGLFGVLVHVMRDGAHVVEEL